MNKYNSEVLSLEEDPMKEPLLERNFDYSVYRDLIEDEKATDKEWKFFAMECLEELLASLTMSRIKIQNLENQLIK